ncbi:MAG TPA: hypothetical protein VMX38_20570 [Verrucomicrobiae bacterium]|jgi:hypothetical protein|nr:hypothetical protein [Verrucomicrobiae bacterium]
MILARICVIGAFLSAPVGWSAPHGNLFQPTNAAQATSGAQGQQDQQQNKTQPQQSSGSVSTTAPAPANANPKPAAANKRKKKTAAADCPDASPNSTNSTNASKSTAGNCPPKIKVVPHGGTSEPSIQLAGGDQANQQRDTNQMLQSTEDNLKKIEGKQLTSDQQQMVNQVRQFMDQSKSAVHTGDLDRARTLAWKAQVLSEELVKPKE